MKKVDKMLIGKAGSGKTTSLFLDSLHTVTITRKNVVIIIDKQVNNVLNYLKELASLHTDLGVLEAALLTKRLEILNILNIKTEDELKKIISNKDIVYMDMTDIRFKRFISETLKELDIPLVSTNKVNAALIEQLTGDDMSILEVKLHSNN